MKIFIRIIINLSKIFFYFTLFLIGVFIICEIWTRNEFKKYPHIRRSVTNTTMIWKAWLNKKNTNPLMPPYKIYANKNIQDIERLKKIVEETSLPKDITLTAYDFLRSEELKEQTRYSAYINNFGFRDPPRSIVKTANTYRIIALGAYHLFGHGVDDQDTYPRQIEKILNSSSHSDIKFEVWNGGRHAATNIVGLARLKTEILQYDPDLILWDYDHVDMLIIGDDTFPAVLLFPDTGPLRFINKALHLIKIFIVGRSIFPQKFANFLTNKYRPQNAKAVLTVLKEALRITEKHNIPILISQKNLPFIETLCENSAYSSDNIYCYKGREAFKRYPPSEKLKKEFASSNNWLKKYEKAIQEQPRPHASYFLNAFQYNKWGQAALARHLADVIIPIFEADERFKSR